MRKKKLLPLIIMFCMLYAMGITSYAASRAAVDFNVTVVKGATVSEGVNTNPDPYSPRKAKEDNEGRFYVTPTWFSNTGEIRGFSRALDFTYTSYPVTMRSDALNITVSNPYLGSGIPAGTVCCLETYFGSSPVTNTLNVTGRYHP